MNNQGNQIKTEEQLFKAPELRGFGRGFFLRFHHHITVLKVRSGCGNLTDPP